MLLLPTPIRVVSLIILTLSGLHAYAQDVVYFLNDGSAVPDTRPTDITETKIVLTVSRKGTIRDIPFSRPRVALAFTKAGNFLILSELATDAQEAKRQLQAFLYAPTRTTNYDFLIKAHPFRLIPARIVYENEAIVNYTTPGGAAASINQNELAATLYQDGRHRLNTPVAEAIPLLVQARQALNDTSTTIVSTVADMVPAEQPEPPARLADSTDVDLSTTIVSARPVPLLSAAQKELYRQQSLAKVEEFVSYLSIITDQGVDSDVRDKAINLASRLFLAESTIEVTSTRRPGVHRYSVRLYLTRLKLLPYLSAHIDWVQTQFVDNLTANTDGTYSGIVTAQQTFTGYGTNKQPTYADLTPKSVRIRLNHPTDSRSEPLRREVLLGNIRVAAD